MNKQFMLFTLLLMGSHKAVGFDLGSIIAAADYAEQKTSENQNRDLHPSSSTANLFAQKWNEFKNYFINNTTRVESNVSTILSNAHVKLKATSTKIGEILKSHVHPLALKVNSFKNKTRLAAKRMAHRAKDNFQMNVALPFKSLFQSDAYLTAYEQKCKGEGKFNLGLTRGLYTFALDRGLETSSAGSSNKKSALDFLLHVVPKSELQQYQLNSNILKHPLIQADAQAKKYVESFIPYRNSKRWKRVEEDIVKELREKALKEVRNARAKVTGENTKWSLDIPWVKEKRANAAREFYSDAAHRFNRVVQHELLNHPLN